jgi:hypothetical protein
MMEERPFDKEVEVTQEDLAGNINNPDDCPVARALKRAYNTDNVLVGYNFCEVSYKGYWLSVEVPNFIQGKDLKPFKFKTRRF